MTIPLEKRERVKGVTADLLMQKTVVTKTTNPELYSWPEPDIPVKNVEITHVDNLPILQDAYDNALPSVSQYYYADDDITNVFNEMEIESDSFSINLSKACEPVLPQESEASSLLKTAFPGRRLNHPKILMAGINKRNFNPPRTMGQVDFTTRLLISDKG